MHFLLFWKRLTNHGFLKKSWTFFPYLWYILFLLTPGISVILLSFARWKMGSPPYYPLWEWGEHYLLKFYISFSNYIIVLKDVDYFYCLALGYSLGIAALATLLCLLIGYPMAYGIARSRRPWIWLIFAILPFFTSFLVRVYAWITLLSPQGLINQILAFLGFAPLALTHNIYAVILGIVYSYLPFMIFPLYVALSKIDPHLIEASHDLGCRPMSAFWRITIPLSRSGMFAGSSLVFIPAVGEFVITELLGGPQCVTIGRVLWLEFFINGDWPIAATLAVIMMLVLSIPIIIFEKLQNFFQYPSSR